MLLNIEKIYRTRLRMFHEYGPDHDHLVYTYLFQKFHSQYHFRRKNNMGLANRLVAYINSFPDNIYKKNPTFLLLYKVS